MSLMAMKRSLQKVGPVVAIVIGILMIFGVVLSGLGGNLSGLDTAQQRNRSEEIAVATVGAAKVTRSSLDQKLEQFSRMGGAVPPDMQDTLRLQLLEQVKQEQAVLDAAKTAGVALDDSTLQGERDRIWRERVRAGFAEKLGLAASATDGEIDAALNKENPGMTVEILKERALAPDQVRLQAAGEGLQKAARGQVQGNEEMARKSLSDMQVRHVLIKFGDGALPEAQAKSKAEKLLAEIKANPAKMADLARQFSDDPGSKAKGGLYDWPPSQRASIVPEFAQALDNLKPGETCPELVTHKGGGMGGYSGFHIVRLEKMAAGKEFPKDFAKEKQKYIDQYVERAAQRKAQALVEAARPKVTIELIDPGLRAAQAQNDANALAGKERDAKLNEALAELSRIKKADDPQGAAPLRRGRIYEQLKKPAEAISAYEEALNYRRMPETFLALAQLYLKQNDKAKVKAQLDAIEKLAVPDIGQNYTIADLYKKLGDNAKAREVQERAQQMLKRQMEQQRASMPPPTASAPKAPLTKKP